mmetsp:Transcript_9855/g.18786  ORF Transcript_9855/g.18786 Transcript_9855/m.18786 type:complete len:80 (+) Transcript_9855:80-319(+)
MPPKVQNPSQVGGRAPGAKFLLDRENGSMFETTFVIDLLRTFLLPNLAPATSSAKIWCTSEAELFRICSKELANCLPTA